MSEPADVGSILGVSGGAAALIALAWKGFAVLIDKKLRSPADVREDKKLDDAANAAALARLTQMFKEADERHKTALAESEARHKEAFTELRQQHEDLRARFDELEQRNSSLVEFVYSCVAVIRDLGGLDLIPKDRPHGIYIK